MTVDKKTVTVLRALFVLIAMCIGIVVLYEPSGGLEISTTKKVVTPPNERTWKKNAIGEEQKLHPSILDSVFRGVGMKQLEEHLYIADFGDMSLKRFTLDGKYQDEFGKGQGRGPGELVLFSDFNFSSKGFLYIIDARKFEIMKFDISTTKYISASTIEYDPIRIAVSGNNLIIQSLMQEKLFKIYDTDMKFVKEFGGIIEEQLQNPLSLDGLIESVNQNGDFIYVPMRASFIFYFNSSGTRKKTVQTIDRIPFQKSRRNQSGNTRVIGPPESKVETEDIHIYEGKLYLSQQRNTEDGTLPKAFMDVYKLDSGKYLYSVDLPVRTNDIVVTEDIIYLLTRETERVRAFSYNQ